MLLQLSAYRFIPPWRNAVKKARLFRPAQLQLSFSLFLPLFITFIICIIAALDAIVYVGASICIDFPHQYLLHRYNGKPFENAHNFFCDAGIKIISVVQIAWLLGAIGGVILAALCVLGMIISYVTGILYSLLRAIGVVKETKLKVKAEDGGDEKSEQVEKEETAREMNANDTKSSPRPTQRAERVHRIPRLSAPTTPTKAPDEDKPKLSDEEPGSGSEGEDDVIDDRPDTPEDRADGETETRSGELEEPATPTNSRNQRRSGIPSPASPSKKTRIPSSDFSGIPRLRTTPKPKTTD